MILRLATFLIVPALCYYFIKKKDRRKYSWKDFIWIIIFSYLWSFFNLFVCGCANIFALLTLGYQPQSVILGNGPELLNFKISNIKFIFNIIPYSGSTNYDSENKKNFHEIIILAWSQLLNFFSYIWFIDYWREIINYEKI